MTAVLLYALEQGPHEQKLIKLALKARRPLPKAIADAPQLALGLDLYMEAFWDLHSCRPGGFGLMPIPWLSMRDWALTYELDVDQQEDLFYLIRVLDNEYLKHEAGKKDGTWQGPTSSQGGWSSSQKPSRGTPSKRSSAQPSQPTKRRS